jgi:hypothetical protein
MKIGIFGDSYSSRTRIRLERGYEDYPCWFEYLESKYDITNYSSSGSSLFFSYDNFINNHSKYDKIIFTVTHYGRLYLPHLRDIFQNTFTHIAGLPHLEEKNKQNKWTNQEHKNFNQHLINYFLYVQNIEEEKTKQVLIIEDILKKRPDSLLISAFSKESLIPGYIGSSLNSIAWLDQPEHLKDAGKYQHPDLRQCHLNIENNKILSEKVEGWLNNRQFFLDERDFVVSKKPYEYYFG